MIAWPHYVWPETTWKTARSSNIPLIIALVIVNRHRKHREIYTRKKRKNGGRKKMKYKRETGKDSLTGIQLITGCGKCLISYVGSSTGRTSHIKHQCHLTEVTNVVWNLEVSK